MKGLCTWRMYVHRCVGFTECYRTGVGGCCEAVFGPTWRACLSPEREKKTGRTWGEGERRNADVSSAVQKRRHLRVFYVFFVCFVFDSRFGLVQAAGTRGEGVICLRALCRTPATTLQRGVGWSGVVSVLIVKMRRVWWVVCEL